MDLICVFDGSKCRWPPLLYSASSVISSLNRWPCIITTIRNWIFGERQSMMTIERAGTSVSFELIISKHYKLFKSFPFGVSYLLLTIFLLACKQKAACNRKLGCISFHFYFLFQVSQRISRHHQFPGCTRVFHMLGQLILFVRLFKSRIN